MSRLTVPNTAYPFITLITKLSPEELSKAAVSLREIGIDFSPTRFQSVLVTEKIFDDSEAELFISELTYIYRSRQSLSLSGEAWYIEFHDALVEEAKEDWKSKHLDAFRDRKDEFVELLALDNFDTVTKAKHLATENERILLHSRIITDVRPVFREVSGNSEATSMHIDASVITSMLQLEYSDSVTDSPKEFFVHLDMENLARLRILCERELLKIRTIQDSLKGLDWNIYNPRSTPEYELESKTLEDLNEKKGA